MANMRTLKEKELVKDYLNGTEIMKFEKKYNLLDYLFYKWKYRQEYVTMKMISR